MDPIIQWAILIISIVAIALAVISIVWVACVNSSIQYSGVPLNIQNGSINDDVDIMRTGGNNLYIANKEFVIVEIEPNNNNKGKEIQIKNNTKQRIHINPSKLDSYDGGDISNKLSISPGHTAIFVFTDTNSLLRLK